MHGVNARTMTGWLVLAALVLVAVAVPLPAGGTTGDGPRPLGCDQSTAYPVSDDLFQPLSVRVADFNGDGAPDVATVGNGVAGRLYDGGEVNVWLNDGTGGFGAPTVYPHSQNQDDPDLTVAPWALVAADFDGSGTADLAVANEIDPTGPLLEMGGETVWAGHPSTVALLSGNGDGTFGAPTDYPTEAENSLRTWDQPYDMAVADLPGTPHPDVVVAHFDSISVLRNTGAAGFARPVVSPMEDLRPVALATGDLNGDTATDVAMASTDFADDHITTGLGTGAGAFVEDYTLARDDRDLQDISAADWTGDGALDLATADSAVDEVSLLVNTGGVGDGAFAGPQQLPVGEDPADVASADLTDNGHLELIAANRRGHYNDDGRRVSSVSVWLNDGAGFTEHFWCRVEDETRTPGPVEVVTADVTGDGTLEALTANVWGESFSVMEFTDEGAVEGTVTDADTGDAVGGADVTVTANGDLAGAAVTDTNGDYRVDELTADDYTVTVDHDDYDAQSVDVVVDAGETTIVDFALN